MLVAVIKALVVVAATVGAIIAVSLAAMVWLLNHPRG